jgi:hypothetical protein
MAYGIGRLLAWLWTKGITSHISVWEGYGRTDGMFSRFDFTYDPERDVYVCPNRRLLRTTGPFTTAASCYLIAVDSTCRCFEASTDPEAEVSA